MKLAISVLFFMARSRYPSNNFAVCRCLLPISLRYADT